MKNCELGLSRLTKKRDEYGIILVKNGIPQIRLGYTLNPFPSRTRSPSSHFPFPYFSAPFSYRHNYGTNVEKTDGRKRDFPRPFSPLGAGGLLFPPLRAGRRAAGRHDRNDPSRRSSFRPDTTRKLGAVLVLCPQRCP
jgi:hypothetical protein